MGMIGRWIDSLSDAERDRIITHPDPTFSGDVWWSAYHDCGCLVGCVVGRAGDWVNCYTGEATALSERPYGIIPARLAVIDTTFGWATSNSDLLETKVGHQFPNLTDRFGAPRMWRLVKARAAKANRLEAPEPATAPSEMRPEESALAPA